MGRYLAFLVLVVVVTTALGRSQACRRCSRARAFFEVSCRSTLYPKLCVEALMGSVKHGDPMQYHNPGEVAKLALIASLARASQARRYMSHMARTLKVKGPGGFEQQAVENCVEQMSMSMEQISQSIRELRRINNKQGPRDFTWHSGNVMTWMSAALTDQTSCLDSFPGGHRLSQQIADVSRFTSNALALVNRFVVRHRAAKRTTSP